MSAIEQIPQLPVPEQKRWQRYLMDSLIAVVGVAILTGIIYAYHLYPTIPNISIVYLLLILLLATTPGRFAALVAAMVAFLATALITSQLTTQTRRSAEQARLREREARILYESGRVINNTDHLDEQLDSIVLALVRVFSPWGVRECALLLADEDGTLIIRADAPIRIESFTFAQEEMLEAREALVYGKIREMSTTSLDSPLARGGSNSILRLIPLKAENEVLGLLCLRIEYGVSWFASKQRMQEELEQPTDQAIFFWTFLDQVVRVIEQARLRARTISNND